ncbi:MAG TPA: DUF4118 domain-containing protein [Vicinamibacteria bacterium]|jgi:hypothetical protein|nr:DUF4118 domain-containing protein [Vicinamibacteria bacterium]
MDDESDLVYLAAGPLGAILLGMAFFPWRGITNASNFTFAFLALTILVAEYGGRRAAVATALTSTLSLDFFLTQPYLRLEIANKDDVIAFVGLAASGLIAAAFGSQRGERITALRRARAHMEAIHSVLRRLESTDPQERVLTEIASVLRVGFPLSAVVVRNERGQVVAFSGSATPTPAAHLLRSDDLLSGGEPPEAPGRIRLPFPSDGGRLDLYFRDRHTGALEIWGNGVAALPEERHVLKDAARIVGAILGAPDHVQPSSDLTASASAPLRS